MCVCVRLDPHMKAINQPPPHHQHSQTAAAAAKAPSSSAVVVTHVYLFEIFVGDGRTDENCQIPPLSLFQF